MAGTSIDDVIVDWGLSQSSPLSSYDEAKRALTVVPQEDYARLGTWNEGLAEIADLMGDSALWLDSRHSVTPGEPRVRNLGGGDRTAVSGAVIYGDAAVLPGVTGNYLSTPDAAALDVTGDLEIVVRASSTWNDGATQKKLVSKAAGSQHSYTFTVKSNGTLEFGVSANGTTVFYPSSTAAVPFSSGSAGWVKVTYTVATATVRFYTAADQTNEPTSWTQLGADVASTPTAIHAGTGSLVLGASYLYSELLTGSIYRAVVRDGIDGTDVLDVDLAGVPNWSSNFTATTGQTVTLTTTAADYGAPSALDAKYGSVLGAYMYDGAAVLPGVNGNYLSVPDEAALDITGDVELAVRAQPSSWGSPVGGYDVFICKNFAGYELRTDGSRLALEVFDGSARVFLATAAKPWADDAAIWLKVALDVDNGAGGSTAHFYWAEDQPTEPTSWTLLESVTIAATLTLTANSDPVGIGARHDGTIPTTGSIYRAIVRDGIDGTTVLDVDMSSVDDYATSFTATTGQTVTVSSTTSDTNDPVLLTHTGENYLYTPGASNNYLRNAPYAHNLSEGPVTLVSTARIEAQSLADLGTYGVVGGMDGVDRIFAHQVNRNIAATNNPSGFYMSNGVLQEYYIDISGGTLAADPYIFQDHWVRHTIAPTNGDADGLVTYEYSLDGVTWEDGGSTTIAGRPPYISAAAAASNTTDVEIGGPQVWAGKTRYWKLEIGGTTHVEFNAATDITDAGAATVTPTVGPTFTVSRTTSGRKTTLVTRPVWLFGTDDYLQVADNAQLRMPVGQDYSILLVVRNWANVTAFQRILAKEDVTDGYLVSETDTWNMRFGERQGGYPDSPVGVAFGELAAGVGVFDLSGGPTVTAYVNGVTGPSTALADTGTANTEPLRVGASTQGTTSFWDGEVVAVAVWRRVLTADEITAINNFYGTV